MRWQLEQMRMHFLNSSCILPDEQVVIRAMDTSFVPSTWWKSIHSGGKAFPQSKHGGSLSQSTKACFKRRWRACILW